MPFTDAFFEAIGYRTIVAKASIRAKFNVINLYKILGLQLDSPLCEARHERISGCSCVIAISNNAESAIQLLIGKDWTDLSLQLPILTADQAPILGILVQAEEYEQCDAGRKDASSIALLQTNKCFAGTIKDIRASADRVTPQIAAGIVAAVSDEQVHATVVEIGTIIYGRTDSGQLVTEHNPELKFSASSVRRVESQKLISDLDLSVDYIRRLRPKTSRLFLNALVEADGLKRFLYFFFSMEVEINDRFKQIDSGQIIEDLLSKATTPSVLAIVQTLKCDARAKHNSLVEKLLWCSTSIWPHVDDATIENFRKLKKIRDDIAHGNISQIPEAAAAQAESLARKLILTPVP